MLHLNLHPFTKAATAVSLFHKPRKHCMERNIEMTFNCCGLKPVIKQNS